VILNYLQTVLPAFTWAAQLRTRAALWQPFLDDGLSINAWCRRGHPLRRGLLPAMKRWRR
jgi:hypothetical protein